MATLEENLTSKTYADKTISDGVDYPSLLRLDPDEKVRLNEQHSIILISALTLPKPIIELPTKFYVDNKLNDPSVTKTTAHVDFSRKNLENVDS